MAIGKTDPAEAQKLADRLSKGNWWKAREGKNRVRILPPFEGAKRWWEEWHLHWRVGPQRTVVPCLQSHSDDKKCVICEEIKRLRELDTEEASSVADLMEVQTRFGANIVDLDHPGLNVQTLLSGPQIIQGLISYHTDEEYGDIDDPVDGFNMSIIRHPKGSQPLYEVRAARESSPIEDKTWLDQLEDLSQMFRVYSYDEQKKLLKGQRVGTTSGPSVDDEFEEAPRSQKGKEDAKSEKEPVKSARTPRCFGKDYRKGDPICDGCGSREGCAKVGKEEGGTEESPADKTSTEAPARPRCFGRMYDEGSAECKGCSERDACKAEKE